MRGLEMIVADDLSPYILSILNHFNADAYTYHIPEHWILSFSECNGKQDSISKDVMNLKEFLPIIQNTNNRVGEINIRAFPKGVAISEPKTYEEYVGSACFLIVLCYDSGYLELYCKDEEIVKSIHTEFKDKPEVELIEYKTDDNDERYGLYVS